MRFRFELDCCWIANYNRRIWNSIENVKRFSFVWKSCRTREWVIPTKYTKYMHIKNATFPWWMKWGEIKALCERYLSSFIPFQFSFGPYIKSCLAVCIIKNANRRILCHSACRKKSIRNRCWCCRFCFACTTLNKSKIQTEKNEIQL